MAQWYMANGLVIKPPYPRTTDHELLVIGQGKECEGVALTACHPASLGRLLGAASGSP
jgi:hypothetical protein